MNKHYLSGVWIGLSAAVFAISGLIRIPVQPLAITLQVFTVFLIPLLFGSKIAFFGFLLYLCLGLIGLPIFSAGGGIGYLLSPTFGYLIGFLVATLTTGYISHRIKGIKGYALAGIVFILILYCFGVVWFYFNMIYVQQKEIAFVKVFIINAVPYMGVDIIKISAAVAVAPVIKQIINLNNKK